MGQIIHEYEVASRKRSDLEYSEAVREAMDKLEKNPNDGDLWMAKGLALAKQSLYREASECYSRAITIDPFKGIYYRHRGHRFLSCYRFEDACADFTLAGRLIPDNWDVWYHLGLSWFLLGDYEQALKAYKQCYDMSKEDSKVIAISDWLWITLKRLGKEEFAQKVLDRIQEGMDAGDNIAYYNRLLMYKGLLKPDDLMSSDGTAVNVITMGFGVANYHKIMGSEERYIELLKEVIQKGNDNNLIYAFGYLAAMVDLEKKL